MAMERVTVEQNGERFTLEVPEGTSDDEITAFLQQQQSGSSTPPITQAEPSLAETGLQQAGLAAVRPTLGAAAAQVGDAVKLAQIAGQVTPRIVGEFMSTPIKSVKDLGSAYVAGHPLAGKMLDTPFKAMPGALARGVATAAMAPESAFLMPYNMAAYEQAKIRANPTAPGLEFNPYAQTVRGEYPTQAAAGAANRRQAIRSQQYGGLTTNEQEMLRRDQELSYAMRLKAARKVLGQE